MAENAKRASSQAIVTGLPDKLQLSQYLLHFQGNYK